MPEATHASPVTTSRRLVAGRSHAYFVSDKTDQLDLSAIELVCEEERGQPPYHPRMMTGKTAISIR